MALRAAFRTDVGLARTSRADVRRASGAGDLPAGGNAAHRPDGNRVSRPTARVVGPAWRIFAAVGADMVGGFLYCFVLSGLHPEWMAAAHRAEVSDAGMDCDDGWRPAGGQWPGHGKTGNTDMEGRAGQDGALHLCSRLGVLDFLGHPAVSVAANGLCDEAVGAEVCRFFGLCAGVDRRSSIVCSVDWMCAGVGHYGVARGHQPVLDALVLPEPAGEVLLGSVERETITEPIYRFRPNRRYAAERSSRRERVRRPLPRSERIFESGERAGSGVAGTEGGIVCDDAAVLRLRRLAGRAGQPDDKGGTAGGKAAHDRRNEQTRR